MVTSHVSGSKRVNKNSLLKSISENKRPITKLKRTISHQNNILQ